MSNEELRQLGKLEVIECKQNFSKSLHGIKKQDKTKPRYVFIRFLDYFIKKK